MGAPESAFLLACINWCWHAFLPETARKGDDHVISITILEGEINVLNEDYHVVHHAQPSIHYTNNPKNCHGAGKTDPYEGGSVFRRTHVFEIFALILLRDYEQLADRYIGSVTRKEPKESRAEIVELIKSRLRRCHVDYATA